MEEWLKDIQLWFQGEYAGHKRDSYFQLFAEGSNKVEGWVCGELFKCLKAANRFKSVEMDTRVRHGDRKWFDFVLNKGQPGSIAIEVKVFPNKEEVSGKDGRKDFDRLERSGAHSKWFFSFYYYKNKELNPYFGKGHIQEDQFSHGEWNSQVILQSEHLFLVGYSRS